MGAKDCIDVTHPEIAAQLKDPSLATSLTAGTDKKPVWVCAEGHEWEATVKNRTEGKGCPYCANKKVLPGYNDLATTNPDLAAQLKDKSLATSLTAGSDKKVSWLCDKGHEWEAKVASRKRRSQTATRGNGCPYCYGRFAIPGETDLATTHAELAAQLKDKSLATSLTAGSNKKVSWLCDKGHEWEAVVNNRTTGKGCPFCYGRFAIPGETDLATLNPELAAQLKDPSLATSLTAGSNKKVSWLCDKGHEWAATVADRKKGNGCSSCAKYGFDQTQPAFVYLVAQKRLHPEDSIILKLGISNTHSSDTRLAKHAKRGLTEVLRTREYPLGSQALEKETEFKCYLKKLPTQFRVTKDELPDGFSEAFLSTAPGWEEHADLAC